MKDPRQEKPSTSSGTRRSFSSRSRNTSRARSRRSSPRLSRMPPRTREALKRKKKYEQQLQQIDGTLSTLEFQREALESASTNTSVLQTMGMAAKSLKAAHQHMDVDKVHDMMDDIAEQQDLAKEITEAISGGLAFGNDVDEDDLLAELEELEQENLDEQLLDTGALPSVPTAALPSRAEAGRNKKDKERDQDFAELEAWAS
ncbi:putative charged multivesicular body protein 4B-like protein CHMP4BP1 isoform X2 [Macrobrachium rosenbergii]|uniref:putative charged multivesicular body protein 4B-like protein CHMP4BP1 isoform X2 n=1 Tax=Macrobrachium rosenbergii TaxID=79674 RepID=UPI0034D4A79E